MNQKENYLKALRCEEHDWVPFRWHETQSVGMKANFTLEIPAQAGTDAFGVVYAATPDGITPDTRVEPILDDVTEWKSVVKIPDVDNYPWEEWAEEERKAMPDTGEKARYAVNLNGLFDRLVTLMGFENALIALLTEPESCSEFFSAIADYKVAYIKKLHQYFKPDVIHYQDDIAHARDMFMSPEVYRELIKPHHKRIIDAIHSVPGVIALQHTCGKCEAVIPDYVEMGVDAWFPAQDVNNLKKIKETYHGRLALEYGLDSMGVLGDPDCDEEALRANVRNAVLNYSKDGGLTISPASIDIDRVAAAQGKDRRINIIQDELNKYKKA